MTSTSPSAATAGFSNPDRPEVTPRRSYPTDLTDRQWARISPLICTDPEPGRGRRRQQDLRRIVDALNYRWHTACTWRMLPHDLPKWQTVYSYVRLWQRQKVLQSIRDAVVKGRK